MSNYENHKLEAMALPFIYKERSVRPTNRRFGSSNWHENIEIIYVIKGEGAVFCNAREIAVRAGDIVVINSNHMHTIAADREMLTHRYLIIDRSFCLANGFDSHSLTFENYVRDDALRDLLEKLEVAYRQPESDPFRVATIRSLVLQLLVCLCSGHSTPAEQNEHTPRISPAGDRLYSRILSKKHFTR